MENISIGFLFSKDRKFVSLIKRKEDSSELIKLTGIGGHIEIGESALDAMIREFEEEAGLKIDSWKQFAVLRIKDVTVNVFKAFSDDLYQIQTKEKDMARFYSVHSLYLYDSWYNVKYLTEMALDDSIINSTIIY